MSEFRTRPYTDADGPAIAASGPSAPGDRGESGGGPAAHPGCAAAAGPAGGYAASSGGKADVSWAADIDAEIRSANCAATDGTSSHSTSTSFGSVVETRA